jgi:hydroxymethylpyrimidine pyrophosphatase-like HAD family hydrolase
MAQWAVFLDIDGTLVDGDLRGPFDDDVESITQARRNGHRVLLCTGRGYGHIPRKLREAPWLDGVVAGGGAYVLVNGRVVYQKTADIAALCRISARFLENGKRCTFQGDTAVFGINKENKPRPDWSSLDERKIAITSPDDFMLKYPDAHIAMMTVDKSIDAATQELLERFFTIYPQIPHFDAFLRGEGKAKGMNAALSALGIAREYSAAIGDSANDLDMIREAGMGIATGNASAELKAEAAWISAPCGSGAVARALEYLGLV